jgi:hypothetical protein
MNKGLCHYVKIGGLSVVSTTWLPIFIAVVE